MKIMFTSFIIGFVTAAAGTFLFMTTEGFFLSIFSGLITGACVVVYFKHKENQEFLLTRKHVVSRYFGLLMQTLLSIRVFAGLRRPSDTSGGYQTILSELEKIMGRNNPTILLDGLCKANEKDYNIFIQNLSHIRNELDSLFLISIAHRTANDRISASISEMVGWIDSVLGVYNTFYPEILSADPVLMTHFHSNICNLSENSLSRANNLLKEVIYDDSSLRWGSLG